MSSFSFLSHTVFLLPSEQFLLRKRILGLFSLRERYLSSRQLSGKIRLTFHFFVRSIFAGCLKTVGSLLKQELPGITDPRLFHTAP